MKCNLSCKEVEKMTQNTKKWVRRIYFALVSIALAAAAVMLMVQCVAIYRLGDSPFTRESIAQHFAPIAVPLYVCIGVVAVGFALSPLLPAAPDSPPDRDAVTLRRLQAKTDLEACPADLTRAVCKTRRARNRHHRITLILLAVGTAAAWWYAWDPARYTEDKLASVANVTWVIALAMGIPFLYGVFTAYFCRRSVKSEIALLRTAPKEAVSPAPKVQTKSERWMPYVQSSVLVVAVGMIVYGALEGGAFAMLAKAIKICTECIGLG